MSSRDQHELWIELGSSMRVLRRSAGLSLRAVEARSGWGRGTLSQVETAKARPPLGLVEWYDEHLGGDGVLAGLFVDARMWSGRERGVPEPTGRGVAGDDFTLEVSGIAAGQLVAPGEELKATWSLRNSGSVTWSGRSLRRIGPLGAARLVMSRRTEVLADCPPGAEVDVVLAVTAPAVPGPAAASWEMVDAAGRACFPGRVAASLMLVVWG